MSDHSSPLSPKPLVRWEISTTKRGKDYFKGCPAKYVEASNKFGWDDSASLYLGNLLIANVMSEVPLSYSRSKNKSELESKAWVARWDECCKLSGKPTLEEAIFAFEDHCGTGRLPIIHVNDDLT